jgi:hypothetical protein
MITVTPGAPGQPRLAQLDEPARGENELLGHESLGRVRATPPAATSLTAILSPESFRRPDPQAVHLLCVR